MPSQFHGKLIGKGGETVKKLTQDHHVKIKFPKGNTGDSPDEIIIIGYRSDVLKAERAIRNLVSDLLFISWFIGSLYLLSGSFHVYK